MKPTSYALAALMIAVATIPAGAAGALAVGTTGNVAQDGVAIGVAGDYETTAEARNAALEECRSADASPQTRQRCQIVRDYKFQCTAVAMDEAVGQPGIGWAVNRDETRAQWDALTECRRTAGSRAGNCRVIGVSCDGL